MTDSQHKVFSWLEHQRKISSVWFRPSHIRPDGYQGGPSAIGRVLSELLAQGKVERRIGDRGNGTTCAEYRAVYWRPPVRKEKAS